MYLNIKSIFSCNKCTQLSKLQVKVNDTYIPIYYRLTDYHPGRLSDKDSSYFSDYRNLDYFVNQLIKCINFKMCVGSDTVCELKSK